MGNKGTNVIKRLWRRSIRILWHKPFCVACRAAVMPHYLGIEGKVTEQQKSGQWARLNSRSSSKGAKTTLFDGSPVTPDHKEIDPKTGQQKGYVVLSEEERAKGYVRPVRRHYIHVGPPGPHYPLRDTTDEEKTRSTSDPSPVKFEEYPEGDPVLGRFWTQEQLDKVGKGCGVETVMGHALSETYARDPSFYGGTFCVRCKKHFPVGRIGEFVWAFTDDERVGT